MSCHSASQVFSDSKTAGFVFRLFLVLLAASFFSTRLSANEVQPINILEERERFFAEQQERLDRDAVIASATQSDENPEQSTVQNWYQIELLIFAYVNTGEENSEIWRNPPRPDFSLYLNSDITDETMTDNQALKRKSLAENVYYPDLTRDAEADTAAQQDDVQVLIKSASPKIFLDTAETGLSEYRLIMRRMEINGQYRTLSHLIWQQEVLPQEAGDFIYIKGGSRYPLEDHLEQMKLPAQTDHPAQESDALWIQHEGVAELEGLIYVHLARFLHIRSDLWLTHFAPNDAGICRTDEPVSAENPLLALQSSPAHGNTQREFPHFSYTPLTNFDLKQSRRMRSNELHYLDHPQLGLLIKFTRINAPM